MTNLDQFESEFRSAARTPYVFSDIALRRVLLVTDEAAAGTDLGSLIRPFLQGAGHGDVELEAAPDDVWRDLGDLIEFVQQSTSDLVVTYRSLGSDAWRWPYTLGDAAEVLTQAVTPPVLLLPHPAECAEFDALLENSDSVMAITDHLTGDDRLVDYAAAMTQIGGRLVLSHVEDAAALERVLDAISKIPEIDTETARDEIGRKLLKGPREYIETIEQTLLAAGIQLRVHGHVEFGHRLRDHVKLVEEHRVDLLVLNTKDDDQLAMHGLAYPLAVQLRQTPLLML